MGINFSGGTQTLPAKVINFKDHYYNTIANFSGSNTSFENMFSFTMTTKKANSVTRVMLEIAGYNSAGNTDNNYRIGYKVGTGLSGTFTYIGGNPNEVASSSSQCLHGNHRGSSWTTIAFTTSFTKSITGSWSAGDTLTWRVDRIGEGTFYANQGSSTGALRFGRGTTKVMVEEFD